jgi:RNA polymerase primary sigma factor
MATATPLTAPNTFLPVDARTKATFGASKEQPKEAPENLLAHYFRDVAGLPVLQSEQEFDFAKDIEALEVSLWSQILSHPALVEPLLGMLELRLEERPKEFTQLLRSSRALRSKAVASTRKRHERWSELAARQIRPFDVDRNILDEMLDHLGRLNRGQATALRAGRVNVKSNTFKKYYRKVRVLTGASQRARNEFVQANLRLVVTIARRFNYGHIPFHDLIQEGNIGLIKAVGRYDYRRGFRFSTYASWWIRHAITRAIADKGRLVRIPVHMLSTFQKVARTSRELSTKLGRPPTSEEICSSTSLSADKVEKIRGQLPNQALSLDSTVSDDDDRRFIELIQDDSETTPADRIGDQEVYEQVQLILSDLKPIEADVLRKRFGLEGDTREHTLSEIGDDYSLSRERIRQIQEQALGKIRRALMRRNAI